MKNFSCFIIGLFLAACTKAQDIVYVETAVSTNLDTVRYTFSYRSVGASSSVTTLLKDTIQVLWRKPYQTPTTPIWNTFVVPIIGASTEVTGYGRGLNNFFGKQVFTYSNSVNYWRGSWARLQTGVSTYKWDDFDAQVKACISAGTQLVFRIGILDNMAIDGYVTINGSKSLYPSFVHDIMQSESVKDWASGGYWYPNWNSAGMLNAWEAFLKALAQHIKDSGFTTAIFCQDVGFFGNFVAEWENYGIDDAGHGTTATDATLIRIINGYAAIFPDMWLDLNQATYDTRYCSNNVAYAGIKATNNKGLLGFRSDHVAWYNTTAYDQKMMNRTFNGVNFLTEVKNRRNFAPCLAEPMNDVNGCTPPGGTPYQTMIDEVNYYGFSTISNEPANAPATAKTNFMNSSNRSGYRIQIDSGGYSSANGALTLKLSYSTSNVAPVYDSYIVNLEIRSGTSVVWRGVSTFNPKLFTGKITVTDSFNGIPLGAYSLYIAIQDPTNYKKPLSLANKGRGNDGAYLLTSLTIK